MTKHLYEIEIAGGQFLKVIATNSRQAVSIARKQHGVEARSVNMVG